MQTDGLGTYGSLRVESCIPGLRQSLSSLWTDWFGSVVYGGTQHNYFSFSQTIAADL
jgi:hypothetical protein